MACRPPMSAGVPLRIAGRRSIGPARAASAALDRVVKSRSTARRTCRLLSARSTAGRWRMRTAGSCPCARTPGGPSRTSLTAPAEAGRRVPPAGHGGSAQRRTAIKLPRQPHLASELLARGREQLELARAIVRGASRPRRRRAARSSRGSSARSRSASAGHGVSTTAGDCEARAARAASSVSSVWLIVPSPGRAATTSGSPRSSARSRTS